MNKGTGAGIKMRNTVTLARVLLPVVLATAVTVVKAEPHDALAMLKQMSDYVTRQTAIELTFDSDIEVITPQLEKIQFASSGEALLLRPDKLRVRRVGGYSDVSLYYDGKHVNIYAGNVNGYARFESPGSLDQLIEILRAGHGVAMPGADLLLTNAYETLSKDVIESKYIGRGVIGGKECEHLAFRNFDTDWQLWIGTGDEPRPCKMVITSKTINAAPQYTIRVTSWKTGVAPAPDEFAFSPPAGAVELDANRLLELDELPPDASHGEVQ